MMRSSPPSWPAAPVVAWAPSSSSPPQAARKPGIVSAAPPSAAARRKSSRVRLWFCAILPPFGLPEGASGEALDEPVEERVVEQGERNARDQRRREEPLPEEDVAADQLRRDADRHRLQLGGGDEGERVDELAEGEGEREDHDREHPRQRDREDDPPQRLEPRAPVHERGVLELERNRLVEPHQQPGRERHSEARVDEDQRPQRVLQAELGDDARERDEEQRRRHEVRQEDRDAEAVADATREPGERVAGRDREHERDQDDRQRDEGRVAEPAEVLRLAEEELDVPERRRLVEDQRVVLGVVEVGVRLERRDQHHVERKREHDGERRDDQVGRELVASGHATSVRRASQSIPTAVTSRIGKRKSEMAAPEPSEPETIPVWKAHVVTMCDELNGPPFVTR